MDPLTDPTAGETLQQFAETQARAQGVDPTLALNIIKQESNWNPLAYNSKSGATGLMQLLPSTAKDYGVTNLTDPAESIRGGMAHLGRLTKKFNGDPALIAAAYNAGEGTVAAHGGVPPFPETQHYVRNVVPGAQPPGYDPLTDPNAGEIVKDAVETKKQEHVQSYAQENPTVWQRVLDAAQKTAQGASEFARGAKQGFEHTFTNLTDAANRIPGVAAADQAIFGRTPEQFAAVQAARRADAAPSPTDSTAQRVGRHVEQAAEFLAPMATGGALATGMSAGRALVPRMLAHAVTEGTAGAATAAAQGDSPAAGGIMGAVGGAASPVIDAVVPALAGSATRQMRAALKPGRSLLRDVPVEGPGVPFNVRAQTLANYILENKLTPESAQALVKQLGLQLDRARQGPGQAVVPDVAQGVASALDRIAAKYGDAPISRDVQGIIDKLYTDAPGPTLDVPSRILGPNGQPLMTTQPGPTVRVPRSDITGDTALAEAQNMRAINRGEWNMLQTPGREAGKAVESSLRTSAKTIPAIADAQKPYPMALVAAEALDKAATRIGNREAVSPFTHVMDAVALGAAFGGATGGAEGAVAGGAAGAALRMVPSVWSRYIQKHPLEAAQMTKTLADALKNHNVPLVALVLTRIGVGGATQLAPVASHTQNGAQP